MKRHQRKDRKMKKLKKIFAIALAMVMVLAMGMTAFAEGGHTISVADSDTHEYKVFQVLTGTLSEEGSNQLGNPAWGADATEAAKEGSVSDFITAITVAGITEQDIAQLVAGKVDTTGDGRGTVKKGSPITGLATGYYVLVDKTTLEKYGSNPEKIDTKALNIVQVVNDINGLQIKWGTTEDKKEIVSDTLGKTGNDVNAINGDTDNVSVGDTVNYKITAKVPANANKYNYFYFVINDTLDLGLTFTEGSIKVYKGSVAEANLLSGTGESADYTLKTGDGAAPKTFQVGLIDAKSLAGQDIIVTYSAVLNENAKIGEEPNKNTSTVSYSNDPNHDYDGENNPGFPASTDDSAMGETPVTETKTFTTGIEIQKVDQNGNVLRGATFKLSGDNTKKVLTVEEIFTKADDGNYYKLKDGTYTKSAPTSEGEYMVKTAGATAGYVIDETYEGADAKTVDGVKYRPYAPATDADKDVYVLHTGNAHLYENTTDKYKKTTNKTVVNATTSHEAIKAVDSNGLVRFDGLGAGTYTVTETVTPDGYNTVDPITVTVTFGKDATPKWSFSGGAGSYDADEGIYKIIIENNKGTELPSTGGMGTTLFYIVGGALVAAAGILLLLKKRNTEN